MKDFSRLDLAYSAFAKARDDSTGLGEVLNLGKAVIGYVLMNNPFVEIDNPSTTAIALLQLPRQTYDQVINVTRDICNLAKA